MSSMMPPDLASQLMGGGDAGPESPADQTEDATGDVSSLLQKAISTVRQATDMEQDPEGKHALEDISTRLQKILADEQKLQDSATGVTPGAKLVRKVSGASSQGGYGG